MPELVNPKMETFAQALARGRKQVDAYVEAGYAASPAAASRMASKPQIADRVAEIKAATRAARLNPDNLPQAEIDDFIDGARTGEVAANGLAAMGITIEWCAHAYRTVYDEAMDNGAYSAANQSIERLQKLIEAENAGAPKEESPDEEDGRIKVSDAIMMLEKMRDLVVASKGDSGDDDDGEYAEFTLPQLPDLDEEVVYPKMISVADRLADAEIIEDENDPDQ